MSDELDVNVIAAEFLKANLEDAVSICQSKVKGATNFIRSQFERTYSAYIRRLIERHSKAKSFFVRSEPIPLYDFFVPLDLKTQRTVLTKPTAGVLGMTSPASIVTGSGGCGKSMMMRHFLLSALIDRNKTPLFLELRSLNGGETTLLDALLSALTVNGLTVDEEYLDLALKAGHFLLLLDGYDELDRVSRRKIAKAVQDLTERYPKNWGNPIIPS